jgi:hypothetical protein
LIGWLAAILAMLVTLALVIGELTDAGQRRWWAGRPLTTDTVGGLLVLLVTVLVVNQLLNRQQARRRRCLRCSIPRYAIPSRASAGPPKSRAGPRSPNRQSPHGLHNCYCVTAPPRTGRARG